MRVCPKCKTKWSNKAIYCVCGEKLYDVAKTFLDMCKDWGVDIKAVENRVKE